MATAASPVCNIAITHSELVQAQTEGQPQPRDIQLSPLDYVVPDVNAGLLLFLKGEPQHILTSIHASLPTALARYPELAGEIRAEQDGSNEHICLNNHGVRLILAKTSAAFSTISANGLSPTRQPASLVPGGPLPQPGDALLTVQATQFSDNVVALGFRRRHKVTDLPGFTQFLQLWSATSAGQPIEPRPRRSLDRTLSPASSSSSSALPPGTPYRIAAHSKDMGFTRPPGPMVTNLFRLSPASLRALKAEAHTGLPDGAWVSTADAIGALFWRAGTRARNLANGPGSSEKLIKLGVAVNGRSKLGSARPSGCVTPEYFGNAITGVMPSLVGADLALSVPLSKAAYRIRTRINDQTEEELSDLIYGTLASLKPEVKALLRTGHVDVFGDDMSLTAWSSYPFYDSAKFGFGSEEILHVSAGSAVGDGVIVVLPTHPSSGGDIEVCIGMDLQAADRLVKDEELLRFAEHIV